MQNVQFVKPEKVRTLISRRRSIIIFLSTLSKADARKVSLKKFVNFTNKT